MPSVPSETHASRHEKPVRERMAHGAHPRDSIFRLMSAARRRVLRVSDAKRLRALESRREHQRANGYVCVYVDVCVDTHAAQKMRAFIL